MSARDVLSYLSLLLHWVVVIDPLRVVIVGHGFWGDLTCYCFLWPSFSLAFSVLNSVLSQQLACFSSINIFNFPYICVLCKYVCTTFLMYYMFQVTGKKGLLYLPSCMFFLALIHSCSHADGVIIFLLADIFALGHSTFCHAFLYHILIAQEILYNLLFIMSSFCVTLFLWVFCHWSL